MSLSTYRALGSRRASSSGRELSALMETFVSSSPKNFQQNEEQQKQRRRCSTSSTLRIPDILRDRKILAKCNSRPISWQRGYAASSAPVPAAVAVASESSSMSSLQPSRLRYNTFNCTRVYRGGQTRRHCVYYSHFYAPYLIKANEGERFNCTRNVRFAGQKKREAKKTCRQGRASINDVPEKAAIFNDVSETLRIANAIRQRLPDNSTAPHPYWPLRLQ